MSKVMLIEDDDVMLSLLQTLLEYEGFQTVQLDGEGTVGEIVSRVRREKPELLLVDVHLRHLNGFDLLRKLRQDDELKSIRVLVSSGMELSAQSRMEGADGFILKPYMPDDLVDRIRDTLKARP
jgi:DNA-binding response OmpR family regulator